MPCLRLVDSTGGICNGEGWRGRQPWTGISMKKQLVIILYILLSSGVNYCFSQQYIPHNYSPDSIEEYSIRGEHLKAIPEELSKFTRLKKLDLSNNDIEEIP